MGRRAVPVILTLAAVASACASAPPMTAQGLEGCYFFELEDQTGEFRLPQGVRFTDRPLEGWTRAPDQALLAVTLSTAGEADYPFGYWAHDDETVTVGYPGGGGVLLTLTPTSSGLRGTVADAGDAVPLGQDPTRRTADIRLERGPCP